jgi:hypothetical protein
VVRARQRETAYGGRAARTRGRAVRFDQWRRYICWLRRLAAHSSAPSTSKDVRAYPRCLANRAISVRAARERLGNMLPRLLIGLLLMLTSLCAVVAEAEAARWKLDGNGECYWDANDDGPNQCGRLKLNGNGECYWEWNDAGADQCSPPSEQEFWNLVAFAEELAQTVTGTSIEDGIDALQLAYDMGLTDEPPDELDLMAAQQYAASAGGGGGSNNISCANKNALKTKAEKAGLTSAVAAAGVGHRLVSPLPSLGLLG